MTTSDKISLASAIATILAMVGTCWVAYLTIGIARATRDAAQLTRDQLKASQRPYVQVFVVPRTGTSFFQLSVSNTGQSCALNLRLTLDVPFYLDADGSENSNLQAMLPSLIESFSPGTQVMYPLGVGSRILRNADRCPLQFTIRARYFHAGEEFVESTTIDLRVYLRTTGLVDPVAEQLKPIQQELKNLHELLDRKLPEPSIEPRRHVLSRRRHTRRSRF